MNNPDRLTQYLVVAGVKVAGISALTGVLSLIVTLPTYLSDMSFLVGEFGRKWLAVSPGAVVGITLVGSIQILSVIRPALSTWGKVQNFSEYKEAVYKTADLHEIAKLHPGDDLNQRS